MPEPITRSTFLYLEPSNSEPEFAQCGTCRFFLPTAQRCALFLRDLTVLESDSCNFYTPGDPNDRQPFQPSVWPADAGFVP